MTDTTAIRVPPPADPGTPAKALPPTDHDAPRKALPAPRTGSGPGAGPGEAGGPGGAEAGRLGRRMEHAVHGFVDDPRRAVNEAGAVLDEAMAGVERAVAAARAAAEQGGDDTEALRLALRRCRSLTRHLLAVPAS